MRSAVLCLIVATPFTAFVGSGWCQSPEPAGQKHLWAFVVNGWANQLSAQSIERGAEYPTVVYLKGNVEIKSPVCPGTGRKRFRACDTFTILHADAAEFHEDTGQIEAHGNVSVSPAHHEYFVSKRPR